MRRILIAILRVSYLSSFLSIYIYSEYYSVSLLSKMSGHHCACLAFLSKHMARVDCRG